MRYLLDTHALIWFMSGDIRLPQATVNLIKNQQNSCLISIAGLWEIAIKYKIGKLELQIPFSAFADFLSDNKIDILSLELSHLNVLSNLEMFHRDPFDRVIIAQAISENLTILTADSHFGSYPVKCVW